MWRLRRWASRGRWPATSVAALALCLAVLSKFWWCVALVTSSNDTTVWRAELGNGLLSFEATDGAYRPDRLTAPRWSMGRCGCWYWGVQEEFAGSGLANRWRSGLLFSRDTGGWKIGASVVYPVLVSSALAALLWCMSGLRSRPHQCRRCGYDRT